jgi:4-hydroxy-2-oxoheptanedioate aldolase
MGRRGYAAPIVRASGFGAWSTYAADANKDVLVAVQIEHVDAVDQVEEIAAIPGIDMAFIGPNDLAGSMGLLEKLEDPEVLAAIGRIEEAARRSGLMLGTIEGRTRDAGALHRDGYRFIIGPNDVSLLANASRTAAEKRDFSLAR